MSTFGWGAGTIDTAAGDPGRFVSMAVDPQNNLHLAYTDSLFPLRVKYAYATPAGIQAIETIESGGAIGSTAIAVEPGGAVHVAYSFNGETHYARKVPNGWNVLYALDAGADVSLAVVSSIPHVAASAAPTGPSALQYGWLDGGTFSSEVVFAPPASMASFASSLAADAQGNLMIAYVDPTLHQLRLATRAGGSWTSEPIDTGMAQGPVTLRLSATGVPHVAYLGGSNGRPRYGVKSGAAWQTMDVDMRTATTVALAVDQYGKPHVLFYAPSAQHLVYVH